MIVNALMFSAVIRKIVSSILLFLPLKTQAMPNKLTLVSFILSLFLAVTSCQSNAEQQQKEEALRNEVLAEFQQRLLKNQLDSIFSQHQFNASVSIAQHNKIIYEKHQGFADFSTNTPLDSNTVFAIASISKQFTGVLILLQQEQGKLNIQDKVSQYLPQFQQSPLDNITIHQLLNHTSGINDFGEGLLFKSGTSYNYSNKGYNYLGDIIAKVSGKSYDDNVKELFTKVGMIHSSTASLHSGQQLAHAYTGTAKQPQKIDDMPRRLATPSIGTAAGGLLSTTKDLHLWNQKLYQGHILNTKSLALFKKNYITRPHYILGNVGYGYGIMSNLSTPEAFFHTGYVKGAPSLLIYYPATQTSVAILSNIANENLGKESIFLPHRRIKELTDAITTATLEVKQHFATQKSSTQ